MTIQETIETFKAILICSGINAKYGSFFGVQMDKSYFDYMGYFGKAGELYDTKKMRVVYKDLKSGRKKIDITEEDRKAIIEKAYSLRININ